ncbi:hypothetical protein BDV36DRAFT_292669 [Aspergillus pseudocaelatus]|uniref:Uncharacterized protein n=1 Tax=Aspergillus pseudocaelatus TaxID=1825620 RepID=A0ABQ6WV61_9EURO|nr:hypothetical protein BDV36DRAFT_292669 [Aspergillus pseudocaelatus]
MHYLWKQPLSGDLPKLLEKVTPQRRQFYANFVEEARILESDHKESQDCECRIPRLESYQIKTLIFDYFCGTKDGLTPHEMDQVLEQIPATLPQVEEIHFDKEPEVNKGAFERLTQRLPGLKYIEHSDWFEFWGNMY